MLNGAMHFAPLCAELDACFVLTSVPAEFIKGIAEPVITYAVREGPSAAAPAHDCRAAELICTRASCSSMMLSQFMEGGFTLSKKVDNFLSPGIESHGPGPHGFIAPGDSE